MSLSHFFYCPTLNFCLCHCFCFKVLRYIYNADGEVTSYILLADATVHYLSEEHLPFAITAILVLFLVSLPPLLLIFTLAKYLTGVSTAVAREGGMHCTYLLKHFKDTTNMVPMKDGIFDLQLESICSFVLQWSLSTTIA